MRSIGISILSVLIWSTSVFGQQKELDQFVNDWHYAAAKSDFAGYFDKMDDSFIYLGTAPGERWTKEEFTSYTKPYFDNKKGWAFKPSNRNWVISKDGKTAWFDEDLDTHMRGCRGSGILVKKKGEWKLVYYNLTVLVENEKMKEFIQLRDEPVDKK